MLGIRTIPNSSLLIPNCSAVLIDDPLLVFAGFDVSITYEQRDLVVLIEACPEGLGKGVDILSNGHAARLTLEGRDGVAVFLVGVDQVAQAFLGGVSIVVTAAGLTICSVVNCGDQAVWYNRECWGLWPRSLQSPTEGILLEDLRPMMEACLQPRGLYFSPRALYASISSPGNEK